MHKHSRSRWQFYMSGHGSAILTAQIHTRRTGTWLVKDGHLIETIKSSTNPTEVTPHTGAATDYSLGRGRVCRALAEFC